MQVASREPQQQQPRAQGLSHHHHHHLSTSEVAIARALLTIPEHSASFSSFSSSASPFNPPSAVPKCTTTVNPRHAVPLVKIVSCSASALGVGSIGSSVDSQVAASSSSSSLASSLRLSTCPECGKIFRGDYHKYNLKKHMTIHAGLRPFPCPVCHLAFNQKVSMKRHFASVHRPVEAVVPVGQTQSDGKLN